MIKAYRYWLGCDLGQAADYTALAAVERVQLPGDELERDPTQFIIRQPRQAWELDAPAIEPVMRPKLVNHYRVRHLERLPLGTPYPAIVARLRELMAAAPLADYTELVLDATGVGRPVVDMVQAVNLYPVPVTITGGDTAIHDGGYWRVPKRDLIGQLQVLLQSKRLVVVPTLPEAETLVKELLNYQMKITAAGNDTYGAWREGSHDDLVLAVALACWRAESIRELHCY